MADHELPSFHVYILLCSDGSLYTGIAKDVARRMALHAQGRGARYTRSRGVKALVYQEGPYFQGDALRRERDIKALSRKAKEKLIGVDKLLHGCIMQAESPVPQELDPMKP